MQLPGWGFVGEVARSVDAWGVPGLGVPGQGPCLVCLARGRCLVWGCLARGRESVITFEKRGRKEGRGGSQGLRCCIPYTSTDVRFAA